MAEEKKDDDHHHNNDWLDEEMKSIQWPITKSEQIDSTSLLKQAAQSFFSSASATDDGTLQSSIRDHSASIEPFLISIRRVLHRYPELMYQERMTSQIVQRVLTDMGITDFTVGWAKNIHSKYYDAATGKVIESSSTTNGGEETNDGGGHGIVVDIGSGQEPCILLRADMDALPIVEETPLPPDQQGQDSAKFHSNHHGKMHACGHDAHMTMLVGATYLIKSLEEEQVNTGGNFPFPGTIRIIFQPAEEGGAGAKRMREEGVLTNFPPVKYAFGMHVWPTLLSGQVGVRSGAMLAAQDNFTLVLSGVGGHAAFPHLCRDPVVASAAFVMNVQTLVSRGMNPLESGVVSVTHIDTGDGAHNVIPAKATIRGTIRALSDDALSQLREGLVHVATKTAEAHGLSLASTEFAKDSYPATMNDDGLFPLASKCAGLVSDTGKHTPVDPTMGAEDFGYLAQGVPAAFFFLGQGGDGQGDAATSGCGKCCGRVPTNLGLHHPEFNLDEKVLKRGVALFLNLALRSLKELSEEGED
mmetsp:Transcript_6807/g.10637  ORF Transcript_6807/g.10637 Transcript_6807/m.10637 type:complete len:528 (-) Transcript_6807:1193-2776(-)